MEIRQTNKDQAQLRIETRGEGEDKKRFVVGYASVTYREGEEGTEYWLWSDLVERVKPNAFSRAIKEKDDVRALFNHDPNQLLSRVGNGLILTEDKIGLRYEFPVDESDPDHIRLVAKLDRGDLTGSSFGFWPTKRVWEEGEDFDVVWLEEVRLVDVSPATYPAYTATEVGMRNTFPISAGGEVEARYKEGFKEVKEAYTIWKNEQRKDHERLLKQLKANAGI